MNGTELRIQNDEALKKKGQDEMLQEMQATIKELEQLSDGLQVELTQK